MKRLVIAGILGINVLLASTSFAFFKPGKLIKDIDNSLDAAKEEISNVGDAVEKKSEELLQIIDEEVEEGLLRFDTVSERFGNKVDELKKDLGDVLSSEQFQKIEGLLDNLNGELIASISEGIVDKLGTRLNVSAEQLEKLSPIVGDDLMKRGTLLAKYLTVGGPAALAEFAAENEKLRGTMNSAIEEILSPEQMEELSAWQHEFDEKVEGLFQKEE